ncbi:MAG: sigma-E factor negative regulatory protein RseB [Alteromonadaceae bacterium]|jgi:sigma-E factor negative regulatory protein RseB
MQWFYAIIILACTSATHTVAAPSQNNEQPPVSNSQNSSQNSSQNKSDPNQDLNSNQNPDQSQAKIPPKLIEASVDTILSKVRKSLNTLNYEAAFIQVRGKFAEPYEWAHGIYQGNEIEFLRSQSGPNLEIVRKGDVIGFFEAETPPYAVKGRVIEQILPALFFDNSIELGDYYSIAVGGKSRIIDRAAQLVRIIAKDNFRFDYWLWLDMQSSLILKSALVSKQGEVLEQFQLTRLNLLPEAPQVTQKLSATILPIPVKSPAISHLTPKWKINWLPQGFKVIARDQHKLSLTNEITDYIQLTDGLVELSIFIQPPLDSKIQVGHVRSGSNIVAVYHAKGFDVSVIGKIPIQTAERIAQSVTAS